MVLAFGWAAISLALILNCSVWNLSPIVILWGWQWWVWHSCPLLLMALNLTSTCPLLKSTHKIASICPYVF